MLKKYLFLILFILNLSFVFSGQVSYPNWNLEVIGTVQEKAYPGIEYESKIGVIGGQYPYSFTLLNSPNDMEIDSNSGVLTWIPNSEQITSVSVLITDSNSNQITLDYSLEVTTNGFYFLSPSGLDSSSNSGNINEPWKTIDYVLSNSPADSIIYFRDGDYKIPPGGENYKMDSSKSTMWISYPNENAKIDFSLNYIYYITNKKGIFKGLEFYDCKNYCFKLYNSNDVTFYKNEMHDLIFDCFECNPAFLFFAGPPGADNPLHTNIKISNNIFHDLNNTIGRATTSGSVVLFDTHKSLFDDNIILNFPRDGFVDKDQTYKNTYRGNYFENIGSRGISVKGQGNSDNLNIHHNILVDAGGFDICGSSATCSNIFYHHNTVYGGIQFGSRNTVIDIININFFNNILVQSSSSTPIYDIYPVLYDDVLTGDGINTNNNLIFMPNNDRIAKKIDGSYVNLNNWQSNSHDTSSLFTDPLLDSNYKPLENSPVCGAGFNGEDIGAINCNGGTTPPTELDDAKTFWVSKTGNDDNDCSTPALSCASIQKAVYTLEAGDTLNVKAGTYSELAIYSDGNPVSYYERRAGIYLTKSGTKNNPIIIQAAPGDEGNVIIDQNNQATGFYFKDYVWPDYIHIKNFIFENCWHSCITSHNGAGSYNDPESLFSRGVLIEGNQFLSAKFIQKGLNGVNSAMIKMDQSRDWVIRNNMIYGTKYAPSLQEDYDYSVYDINGNAGINGYSFYNVTIENNEFIDGHTAMYLKDVADNAPGYPLTQSIVKNNEITGFYVGAKIFNHYHIVKNNIFEDIAIPVILQGHYNEIRLKLDNNFINFKDFSPSQSSNINADGIAISNDAKSDGSPLKIIESNGNIFHGDSRTNYKFIDGKKNIDILDINYNLYSSSAKIGFYYNGGMNLDSWRISNEPQIKDNNQGEFSIENVDVNTLAVNINSGNYSLPDGSPAINMMPNNKGNAGPYQYGNEIIGLLPSHFLNGGGVDPLVDPPIQDNTPPTKPTIFEDSKTSNTISISWSESIDTESSPVSYEVYKNGIKETTISTLSYTFNELFPNTQYSFYVGAIDTKSNGVNSDPISITTDSSTPPTTNDLTNECDNWQTNHPEWIFCDDFEAPIIHGDGGYFEYDDDVGDFVRVNNLGVNGSFAMKAEWQTGEENAGALRLGFGRVPNNYFNTGLRNTEDFREIYYRHYIFYPNSWLSKPEKLSRATVFAKSDWSQAMLSHVWDISTTLGTDLATCVTGSTVDCIGYNDINSGRINWLGNQEISFNLYDSNNLGQWYCIEHQVKLNDPGLSNGEDRLYVNDNLEIERTGLNYVGSYTDYGINSVSLENYWNSQIGGSVQNQERYWDNFVVSTERIGCGEIGDNKGNENGEYSITIGPTADTYLRNDNNNFVSETQLNTYTWPVNTISNTIILQFDISSIPNNAEIISSELSLYQFESDRDESYDVSVHRINNKNPILSEATGERYSLNNLWTSHPTLPIPMGLSDISSSYDVLSLNKVNGFKTWDVKGIIYYWLNNPTGNYGILINSDDIASVDSYRYFRSSEFSDINQRPKLTITYNVDSSEPTPVCGNNLIESGETCDDGDTVTGTCAYNQPTCSVCSSTCQTITVTGLYCGDSIVQSNEGETCDDGNTISGDSCSSTCKIEVAQPKCGDGIINNDEQCDGGNLNSQTCQSLGYEFGSLTCSSECNFVTTNVCSFDSPSIDLTSPINNLSYGSMSGTLILSTDEESSCRYSAGLIGFSSMTPVTTSDGFSHSKLISFSDSSSSHSYFLTCKDLYNQNTTQIVTFNIDGPPETDAPVITNIVPNNIVFDYGTTSVDIVLTTDEVSVCRYSSMSGKSYGSMEGNEFSVSNSGYSHSLLSYPTQSDTTYSFYVRCMDIYDNVNTVDKYFNFSIGSVGPEPEIEFNLTEIVSYKPLGVQPVTSTNVSVEIETKEPSICRLSKTYFEGHADYNNFGKSSLTRDGLFNKGVYDATLFDKNVNVTVYVSCIPILDTSSLNNTLGSFVFSLGNLVSTTPTDPPKGNKGNKGNGNGKGKGNNKKLDSFLVASITDECVPRYSSSLWSICTDGIQTRTVTDSNNCVEDKIENRACILTNDEIDNTLLNAKKLDIQKSETKKRTYNTQLTASYNEIFKTESKLEDETFVLVDGESGEEYLGRLVEENGGEFFYSLERIDESNLADLKFEGLVKSSTGEKVDNSFRNLFSSPVFITIVSIVSILLMIGFIIYLIIYIRKIHE